MNNVPECVLNSYYNENEISNSRDFFYQEARFINEYRPFVSEESDVLIDCLERYIQEANIIDSLNRVEILDESFSLKDLIAGIKKAILSLWQKIKEFFGKIFRGIKNILNGHTGFLKDVISFKGFMRNKKNNSSVNEDAIFMSIFGEESILTEDVSEDDDVEEKISKLKEQIESIKDKLKDKPDDQGLKTILMTKEAELSKLEQQSGGGKKKKEKKAKKNKNNSGDSSSTSQSNVTTPEDDKKLVKKLNKAGKALVDEDVMYASVTEADREKACMRVLYESEISSQDDKLFSVHDLRDADNKISDAKEASTAARTAKLFGIDLPEDKSASQYISDFVESTYYSKGKASTVKYIELVKKAGDVADQFIQLNSFMNGSFYNKMLKCADRYERWYNNYLGRLEKDYIDYQKFADKRLNKHQQEKVDDNYLTRKTDDKGNSVSTDKVTDDDIKRVRAKLQALQSICSNHVAFIRTHSTALTNCATKEYRMLRHALILMMNYEGFYKKNSGEKTSVYSRMDTNANVI